jgi:Pectate lyase superfamily protein
MPSLLDNFVFNGEIVYADKTNIKPATNATKQWSAEDAQAIKGALNDIRTVINVDPVNVFSFGVTGDGVTDDTVALQAAIDATAGRTLYLPKAKYKTTSTLIITDQCHRIIGDFGNRFSVGGTEIQYFGTGPCIQIGVENPAIDWDANFYGGPQFQIIEDLWISHGATDTVLAGAPASGAISKTGAYGIWDWYSGSLLLNRVGIERFEANYVGIQSDINNFTDCTNLYSQYGFYLGPRSDQNSIKDMLSFFCNRSITIDRAGHTRICDGQFVFCGTDTISTIEVRQGSHAVVIERPWFERSGLGYQGTDAQSFVSVGEVPGYGPGGTVQSPGGTPTTTSVQGCAINDALSYSVAAGLASHTKYFVSVNKCQQLLVSHPSPYAGGSLTVLDALVGVQAASAPTSTDTQIEVHGVSSATALAKQYVNLGAGTPAVWITTVGSSGQLNYSTSTVGFATPGNLAGAEQINLTTFNQPGNIYLIQPTYAGGQINRLRVSRSIQPGAAAAAPTVGTWEQGDRVYVTDPAEASAVEWVCVASGTPGTWRQAGIVHSAGGLVVPANTTLGSATTAVHLFRGAITQATGTNADGYAVTNSNTGQTVSSSAVKGRHAGTFDTTAGALFPIGVAAQAVATRSAGANTLRNIGMQATASGGQSNFALETLEGDVMLNTTSGSTTLQRAFRMTNELVPAVLGANQDNYNPTGQSDAAVVLLSASAPVNITGIAGGSAIPGVTRWYYNTSANAITLTHQDAASSAANRIIGRGGIAVVLTANTGCQLYYSPSLTRWLVMADTL